MKRTFLFIACIFASLAMPAQESSYSGYLPFVELGKQWNVVRSNGNPGFAPNFVRYLMLEEVERDGKLYTRICQLVDDQATWHDAGLFREENCRVYKYDGTAGRDFMLYDFSLKEGDTFTYDLGYGYPMNCKVLKQGWLSNGPQIVSTITTITADSVIVKDRLLRTLTIGVDQGTGEYHELVTWVEGVGALENMFSPLLDGGKSCLAYVERKDNETGYLGNEYLPFPFYNSFDSYSQVRGCNLPTGAKSNMEGDRHHKLTYELEGGRLYVSGEVFCNCGPNHYAYFFERPTDDPLVHRIEFVIQEVEPTMDCMALHATEFYVPGFDPNLNYIIVDNQGEEHPVIKIMPQLAYRPFIEEGKVWKVGAEGSGNPVQRVEYYYFEGDTIIDGKTCKQMMRQRYVGPDYPEYEIYSQHPSLGYVGAWYEEDKKVYAYDTASNQFQMMYDFSVDPSDTLQIDSLLCMIGPRQTGGIKGFKGVYREVRMFGDSFVRSTPWLEGVGGIYGPTINVFDGELADPSGFLMSCTVGDKVIYLNDGYEDGATPEGMDARKRLDFTHTIKTKPKAPRREKANQQLYGEYNNLQLTINLDPLDEAYLVRITDESGNTVYERAVNAGNIVGLNIDILTYAEGRYTVTVENSQESFIGIFEKLTTGISEAGRLNDDGEMINDNIYNLQGQRISTLQKGLNIVNGKKVFNSNR